MDITFCNCIDFLKFKKKLLNKQECIALRIFFSSNFPLSKAFVSLPKQTGANNCPPLLMRLLCLVVWSKIHCFYGVLKKCLQIEYIFYKTYAQTTFYHRNLRIICYGSLFK